MDSDIKAAIAHLEHSKDKEMAHKLGVYMERCAFRHIEPIERVLRIVPDPKLVDLAWQNAMAIHRLPKLTPEAFMAIGSPEVLPQVVVSHRLLVSYKSDGESARMFTYHDNRWLPTKLRWRNRNSPHSGQNDPRFPKPSESYQIMDFLEFMVLLAGRKYDAGWHVSTDDSFTEQAWNQELHNLNVRVSRTSRRIDRGGRMYSWDRTRRYEHPNWHRTAWDSANRRFLWNDLAESRLDAYKCKSSIHLPTSINSPMWSGTSKKDWEMIYSWANAMKPKV